MRPNQHFSLEHSNQYLKLLRFTSIQARSLPLKVEGLQSSGRFATEMTARSTEEYRVIEEGKLVHGCGKVVR